MNEILRFNYKGTELYIFEENNKFIYLKQKANNVTKDLTNEEKEVMSKVLLQLMPSRNLSDLGYIKYNQKKFRHFYDIRTGFHVFYEGDNFKTPNDYDLYNLNKVFNYENDYVAVYRYSSQEDKRKNKIKRVVKLGSLTLVVLISLYGIKVGLNNLVKDQPIVLNDGQRVIDTKEVNKYIYSKKETEKVQVTSDDIIKSIVSNTNISELEKKLFLSSLAFSIS